MNSQNATIRTKANPNCFLCGSTGDIAYEDLADRHYGVAGLWQLKRCPSSACGLIWLDPAPVPADLHLAYQNYFTHSAAEDGKTASSKTLRELVFGCYQAAQYVPSAIFGLNKPRAEMDAMYLHDLAPGRLLDVGCGDGVYLNRMRQRGWKVDGIDFDQKAVRNAKLRFGLELHCGDLTDAKFPDDNFDAITMSHVIEHVPNPVEFLQEARRVLKPGGRVVILTPNTRSNGLKEFGEHWFGLDAPRHLNLYDPANLSECAGRAGFKLVRAFSTAAHADIFFGGSDSIRHAHGKATRHQPQFDPVRLLKILAWQYTENSQLSNDPNCGEEAVYIGRKDS